jgi:hypothetical protein
MVRSHRSAGVFGADRHRQPKQKHKNAKTQKTKTETKTKKRIWWDGQ